MLRYTTTKYTITRLLVILECGPMPNVMVALLDIGDALCSTQQRLAEARCWSAMQ